MKCYRNTWWRMRRSGEIISLWAFHLDSFCLKIAGVSKTASEKLPIPMNIYAILHRMAGYNVVFYPYKWRPH